MRKTFNNFISTVKSFEKTGGDSLPTSSDLKTFTWEQKRNAQRQSGYKHVLNVKNNSIYFIGYYLYVRRIGKSFFRSYEKRQSIYIDSKETNIKCSAGFIKEFLTHCNITWWKDITDDIINTYFTKPSIFRSIVIGTIYSEETLYRAIANRIYHCKEVSWRNMREYCKIPGYEKISFVDLAAFTKNINSSIISYVNSSNKSLYRDILIYAVDNNQIVDFNWSTKRLNEEHLRQIRLANAKEISSKEQKPIYNLAFELPKNIELLNTELDIFMEGLKMSHCLYRCYYGKIKNHNYIAFHMTDPEDCTFSFCLKDDKVTLDQIYLKYDKPVKSTTKDIALNFMFEHYDKLREMFFSII